MKRSLMLQMRYQSVIQKCRQQTKCLPPCCSSTANNKCSTEASVFALQLPLNARLIHREYKSLHCTSLTATNVSIRRPSMRNQSSATTPSNSNSMIVGRKDEQNSLPMVPINFDTSSSIKGEESQILEVALEPNQKLRAESGAMIFMSQGVEMSTSLGGDSSGGSSSPISEGFKRMLTGQNMFISDYTYHGPEGTKGTLALGTDFPSKILRLSLAEYGNKIICQKSAYLASDLNVDIQMEFAKKFSAGFFGGEGFILQGLVGDGDVFVKAGGTLIKRDLQEGETIRISSGSLVAFTKGVEFDIQTMPGFKNVLFGGEGLFVTTLTGPGTIWLQGMPPDRMISEIVRRMPSSGGIGLGIPIGMGGSGGDVEGGVGDDGNSDAASGDSQEASEDLVASSDAAIEADRNATVASSGMSSSADGSSDAESSSALFGDAAPTEEKAAAVESPDSSSSSIPDWEDESTTTFSTEDSFSSDEDLTNDDYHQSQQQLDDFQQDETSFSTESGGGSADGADGDGSGIMDFLWDFFFDNDE